MYVFTWQRARRRCSATAVAFSGVTDEYFAHDRDRTAPILRRTAGAPLAPIALTVAQAATEAYEGVLVTAHRRHQGRLTRTRARPTTRPARTRELFELNDAIVAWDSFYAGGQATWTTEAAAAAADMTPTVTGVMFYRFNRRRICPRTAADITP